MRSDWLSQHQSDKYIQNLLITIFPATNNSRQQDDLSGKENMALKGQVRKKSAFQQLDFHGLCNKAVNILFDHFNHWNFVGKEVSQ